jgi:hypothetical protein
MGRKTLRRSKLGWTQREDAIINRYTPKRAMALLPGYSYEEIRNRRIGLLQTARIAAKKTTPQQQVQQAPDRHVPVSLTDLNNLISIARKYESLCAA